MKRKILLIILTIFAAALLAGCGELSYEMKARSYAESYIKDKYGFDADITEVLTSGTAGSNFPGMLRNLLMSVCGTTARISLFSSRYGTMSLPCCATVTKPVRYARK